MNFRCIIAGLLIVGIGIFLLLPSIILTIAGSPIKGETDLGRLIVNGLVEHSENEVTGNIARNVNSSFNIIDSIPHILIIIGLIIVVIGLFL